MSQSYPGSGGAGLSAQVDDDADGVGQNNSATASVPVVGGGEGADLVVVMGGLTAARSGEPVTATATVSNAGTVVFGGPVSVQLYGPTGDTTASGEGWTCTAVLLCTHPGPVPAGGALPALTLRTTAPAGYAYGISASAALNTDSDANTNNNSAAYVGAAIGGIPVDLAVRMSGLTPASAGEPVTFSAQVTNTGTAASSGEVSVQLYAPVPDAVATGTGWTCTAALVCTHAGAVPAGGALPAITVTAPAPAGYQSGISASAWVSNDSDPYTGNNGTTIAGAIGGIPVDLSVSLHGGGALLAGGAVTYTARVSNSGTTASTGEVSVQLFAPFAGATASGTGWTCTAGLVCTHPGPVPTGGSLPDITLAMPVPTEVQAGAAAVSASLTNDSDANHSNDSVFQVTPLAAPLAAGAVGSSLFDVEAVASQTWPGGVGAFQAQVTGDPDLAGRAATLTVELPTDLSYVDGSALPAPQVADSGRRLTWHVPIPAAGELSTIRFSTRVGPQADQGTVLAHATLTAVGVSEQRDTARLDVVNPTLTGVQPAEIGRSSAVTVALHGGLLQPSFTYTLVRAGQTVRATDVTGGNRQVDATFDTTSIPPGVYDVRVTVADGLQLALPGAVTVGDSAEPGVSVDVTGPAAVRMNSPGRYYATVTNDGNVDAFDVPVLFTAPVGTDMRVVDNTSKALIAAAVDSLTSSEPSPTMLSPAQAAEVKSAIQTFEQRPMPDPGGRVQYLLAVVPRLAPGATSTAVFEVTPRSRIEGGVTASVPVDTAYFAATNRVSDLNRRAFLPQGGRIEKISGVEVDCGGVYAEFCAVSKQYMTGLNQAQRTAAKYGCVSFAPLTGGFFGSDCQFNNPFSLSGVIDAFGFIAGRKFPTLKPVIEFVGIFSFAKGIYDDLMGAAEHIERAKDGVQFGVTSVDPNDKLAPAGAGPQHYITADRQLDYTIRFENVASASAAAQRVTIVDDLPAELDWASVRIIGATVSGVDVPLTETSTGTIGVAALDAGRTVLVDAEVNPTTGRLVAHLQGPPALDDPFTPTPYGDFLPPNTIPPLGEGQIRLVAKTRASLPTGTEIRNKAAITFDDHAGGPTIDTPATLNTVDADSPTITLDPLPATSSGPASVTWQVDDIGSGAADVQLFQSVDDGPWQLVSSGSMTTPVLVPLEGGHPYRFQAVAVDKAGNRGEPSNVVLTRAAPPGKQPTVTSLTASPNPARPGQTVRLTATVTADTGQPTGAVTFRDGTRVLGAVPLEGGQATLTTSALRTGTRTIEAAYGGNAAFTGSAATTTVYVGPPPAISSLTPGSGRVGTVVDIHGRSLTATTAVRFNGVPARILHNTDTSLRVLVPAGATSGKVSVTTRYGQATSKATFVVKPPLKPVIKRVSPDAGRPGTRVTISGAGLATATSVLFGDVPATIVDSRDDALVVRVPDSARTGRITVITPASRATSAIQFRVLR